MHALNTPPGHCENVADPECPAQVAAVITVLVNGVPESTTARTLQAWVDALQARGVAPTALATAVNGQFVPRSLRAQQPLAEGDTILTFQPIQGG